jgi:putative FmdB family regulatory protein
MVGTAELDMPTYEFSCHKCELIFEHIYQSVPKNIPKKKKCPECGKLAEKMISAGVFHMKGMPYRLGKTEVTAFYNEAIRDSKERLNVDTTPSPYRRYVPTQNAVKSGMMRVMSESEISRKQSLTHKVGDNINNIKDKLVKKKKNV